MYPQISINLKKLRKNLDAVAKTTKEDGKCSMMVVTKAVCADEEVVKMIADTPAVDFLADSRISNIASYADVAHKNGKKTVLLRIPMQSEIAEVAKYVDLCMISEIETIKLLNAEASKLGKKQDILLMIDMGDLREGIFFQNKDLIFEAVEQILAPKNENLSGLVEIAREIEAKFGIKLEMVSGGNSSSIYLIDKGELPEGINNLRLGESVLLGNDTAYSTRLPGTDADAFVLKAEIVELKKKPSLPIGEVGVDAFGQKPYYEDRGIMDRAIIAIGKQDTDLDSMEPIDSRLEIMGGSSDHIIVDVTKAEGDYKVGDVIEFTLSYGGLLKCMTSKYVEKTYIK